MRFAQQYEGSLSLLRERLAGSDLLPEVYKRYRPVFADALCFFLRRLPVVRLRRIFAQQISLPVTASTSDRLVALLAHSPALHKLGQVLARDHRLSAGLRHRLQRLESLAPQMPTGQVLQLLEHELENRRARGIELGAQPLAEGSVGVVMPFVWHDSSHGSRHGVFKLLKPGIRQKLEQDLQILSRLGKFLDEDCDDLHLPALEYQETFNTIRDLLVHEVCFEQEQQNLATASQMYQSVQGIVIPQLLPFCSPNVTAMERIFGRKIPDAGSPGSGRALARLLVKALVATPIFSAKPDAPFHADPHGGNLLITDSGHLGILDWSLTGSLQKAERIELMQIMLDGLALDLQGVERALERLSRHKPNQDGLRQIVRARCSQLQGQPFPSLTWLIDLIDALVLRAGLRLSPNLLLFRKSLVSVAGVAADLIGTNQSAANRLLDQAMLESFLAQWIAEWPDRCRTPLHDRSFRTHVAGTDLMRMALAAPAWWGNWWKSAAQELLNGLRTVVSPA